MAPDPRTRVPLKLPQDLLDRIDADAEEKHQTRTAWLEDAARQKLERAGTPAPAARPRRPTSADLAEATVTQVGPATQDHENGEWRAVGTVPGFEGEWPVAVSKSGHRGPWLMPGVSRDMPAHGKVIQQVTGGIAAARKRNAEQGRAGVQTSATVKAGVKPIPRQR